MKFRLPLSPVKSVSLDYSNCMLHYSTYGSWLLNCTTLYVKNLKFITPYLPLGIYCIIFWLDHEVCWADLYIVLLQQAKAAERYPCAYSFTALMMSMGTVQSFVYSVCTVRDWNEWKLGWNVRLFVVAYAVSPICKYFSSIHTRFRAETTFVMWLLLQGIVGSGLMFSLIAWCVRKKGPVFVSIFNPLMLIMVAIAGSLFLDEKIHLGTYVLSQPRY